ncbi:MobA protein [Methanobrevibacter arboriphilus JCM 13429 = DSM 1125]|uniref:MobA protein n=1 Tax=Methanobrevibacter arboriphilus JCM 13429 = DSM 1125 TaxID=1300164 RepID=A0A1V6N4G4_METAZ|nr:NTP transferase domain-containing protein [Methanobrevibacter arboriphilus]OQD59555.1 MobA protein [Methanobrevibacter arboriphilus JCM 13429 = DSM 1125]
MLISSVITAAGRNFRMENSQIKEGSPVKNKLLLPFPSENSINTVIETTINNVLSSDVDECIVVLGHFAANIKKVLANIDDRVKIIENENINVDLSTSLLNGLKNCKNKYVLCSAGDQPTISSKTYKNIINSLFNLKTPEKSISILRRKDSGLLKSPEGLGMPFIANKDILIKYLSNEDSNLNPILRKIFKDQFPFYGVEEDNSMELININNYKDYKFVLNNF